MATAISSLIRRATPTDTHTRYPHKQRNRDLRPVAAVREVRPPGPPVPVPRVLRRAIEGGARVGRRGGYDNAATLRPFKAGGAAGAGGDAAAAAFLVRISRNGFTMSSGIGNTTVELCSPPISESVCR